MFKICQWILIEFFHFKFKKLVKCINNKILICDIDNSIANTWPQWNVEKINYKTLYKDIPPLIKSIDFVKEYSLKYNFRIIFLSARPYNQIFNTKKWVSKYFSSKPDIFIVKNAKDKLWFFKYLVKNNISFEIFDDLSYNHENGEVKYYYQIINYLKNNNIKHYDYIFILKLNEENS